MDKGSGAVRRVPFWRSLQTKFALTYIVIVAAVLIPVSYTHLDVYKRQGLSGISLPGRL